jgi:hypothetical protein
MIASPCGKREAEVDGMKKANMNAELDRIVRDLENAAKNVAAKLAAAKRDLQDAQDADWAVMPYGNTRLRIVEKARNINKYVLEVSTRDPDYDEYEWSTDDSFDMARDQLDRLVRQGAELLELTVVGPPTSQPRTGSRLKGKSS